MFSHWNVRATLFSLFVASVSFETVHGLDQKLVQRGLNNRQLSTDCAHQCARTSAHLSECAGVDASIYPACVCEPHYFELLVECVNCSITEARSQADIDAVQYMVNSCLIICSELGYAIPMTAEPTSTFPCSMEFPTLATTYISHPNS